MLSATAQSPSRKGRTSIKWISETMNLSIFRSFHYDLWEQYCSKRWNPRYWGSPTRPLFCKCWSAARDTVNSSSARHHLYSQCWKRLSTLGKHSDARRWHSSDSTLSSGIHNPDPDVRNRVFYLFAKFVRELKNSIDPSFVPAILNGIGVSIGIGSASMKQLLIVRFLGCLTCRRCPARGREPG